MIVTAPLPVLIKGSLYRAGEPFDVTKAEASSLEQQGVPLTVIETKRTNVRAVKPSQSDQKR